MKIAVITGASSGMGLEFAKAIDAEETLDEIWLIARRRERLEDLAKELRTPRASVRAHLRLEPKQATPKTLSHKKKEPER